MSPASGLVLGSATVVASPALLAAATGSLPIDVAMLRLIVAIVVCWAALSVVEALVVPGGRPVGMATPTESVDADADAGAPAP